MSTIQLPKTPQTVGMAHPIKPKSVECEMPIEILHDRCMPVTFRYKIPWISCALGNPLKKIIASQEGSKSPLAMRRRQYLRWRQMKQTEQGEFWDS
jgi:hypothetical protein